jgi:ABC-2 type transport system permease protein
MIGLALLLSSLNVVFRDIASIHETVVFGWLYATPIFYDYSAFNQFLIDHPDFAWARWVFAANPMVGIIVAYRRAFLYNGERALAGGEHGLEMPDTMLLLHLLISLAIALAVLGLGILVFRRLSRVFADRM